MKAKEGKNSNNIELILAYARYLMSLDSRARSALVSALALTAEFRRSYGLTLEKYIKKYSRSIKMKLKGYSIWVCDKCHTKMFVDRFPVCCPYCKSIAHLGCAGYVKLDLDF